jgi:hypothetical protein
MQKIDYTKMPTPEIIEELESLRTEFHALFDYKNKLEREAEARDTEIHNLLAIVTQSNIVRDIQKLYFQNRNAAYLERSKIEERKLDVMIAAYKKGNLINIAQPVQTKLDL